MINFDQVKRDAIGRWDGIYSAFGVEVGDGRHTACPVCGGRDRFRMDNKEGKGTWYCSQCDPHAGDGWALLQIVLGMDFKEVLEEVGKIVGTVEISNVPKNEKPASPEFLREIFQKSEPASFGNLVGKYLRKRGLSNIPQPLRFSPHCYEPETKKHHAAMLAVFSMPDGTAVTMHRTFLSETGEKLNIEKPKKILPPIRKMSGGAVRLFDLEDDVLGVAEGVETAIACKERFKLPVWATLSATLLEVFEPPPNIRRIKIYADNDKNYTGQKAAMVLANKLTIKHKLIVDVFTPETPGDDWLDVTLRRKLFKEEYT